MPVLRIFFKAEDYSMMHVILLTFHDILSLNTEEYIYIYIYKVFLMIHSVYLVSQILFGAERLFPPLSGISATVYDVQKRCIF